LRQIERRQRLFPFCRLAGEEACERVIVHRQNGSDLVRELLDDRRRRSRRSKQADESGGAPEARHAALGDGRDLWRRRKALAVDEPERAQASGLDMRVAVSVSCQQSIRAQEKRRIRRPTLRFLLKHRRERSRDRHRPAIVALSSHATLRRQRHQQAIGLEIADLKPR